MNRENIKKVRNHFNQSADSRAVLMAFADAYDAASADTEIAIRRAVSDDGQPAVVVVVGGRPFAFTVRQAGILADAIEHRVKAGATYLADLVLGLRHGAAALSASQPGKGE